MQRERTLLQPRDDLIVQGNRGGQHGQDIAGVNNARRHRKCAKKVSMAQDWSWCLPIKSPTSGQEQEESGSSHAMISSSRATA
jgi:hypothetical protein